MSCVCHLFCMWPDTGRCLLVVSYIIHMLMAKKLQNDDRFVSTDNVVHQFLGLDSFPNFSATGDIEGMRARYYGRDAFLVQAGDYIYRVDEDTFQAVRDSNFLASQPEWLRDIARSLTEDDVTRYRQNVIIPNRRDDDAARDRSVRDMLDGLGLAGYDIDTVRRIADGTAPATGAATVDVCRTAMSRMEGIARTYRDMAARNQHDLAVMSCAVQAEMAQKMVGRIRTAVTDARILGTDDTGRMLVGCRIDGVQMPVTPLPVVLGDALRDLPPSERQQRLAEAAAQCHAGRLFEPLAREAAAERSSHTLTDDRLSLTAEKVSAVLEKFYSPGEAEELLRIITEPTKSVDDVRACMHIFDSIYSRAEALAAREARITSAGFVYPDDVRVAVKADIDGVSMPPRMLSRQDAGDIRSMDMSLLTLDEIRDMAADLCLTYYEKELGMTAGELREAACSSPVLTGDDARMFSDLEKALADRFPDGVALGIDDFTVTDLFSYIQYGSFRDVDLVLGGVGADIPESDETLRTEARIPKDRMPGLGASQEHYCDESYEDFINGLDNAEAFDASTTELMHTHPDLTGARLVMYDRRLPRYLYVEGRHIDTAVAWMLQDSRLDNAALKTLLRDPAAAERKLAAVKGAALSDYDADRIARMNMPPGLDMVRNPERLYFFERGTLGFAAVDTMRGVTYSGETLSREAQDFINGFVLNGNVEARQGRMFFTSPGPDCPHRACLDTMKNTLVEVDEQRDIYGRTLHTCGDRILTEGDMQHFQDVTGRITDARIIGIDRPMVRCRVDGVQQPGQPLTKAERIRAGHFAADEPGFLHFAQSVAVSHFATMLYDTPAQRQGQGRGR